MGTDLIEPGWQDGMTEAEYRDLDAASASGLCDFMRSPAYYRWRRDHPDEETDDTILGTAVHCAILEPDRFATLYATTPDDAPKKPDKRQREAKKPSAETVAAIKWWDEFNANNAAKRIVSRSIYADALRLREAFEKCPEAVDLLAACPIREVPGVAIHPIAGIPVKIKPDARGESTMLDLKTCRGADHDTFRRAALSGRYHGSEALYRDTAFDLGWMGADYRFVVLDKSEGPVEDACVVWTLDAALVEFGRVENERLLLDLAACARTKVWRRRTGGKIACPPWLGKTQPVEDDEWRIE